MKTRGGGAEHTPSRAARETAKPRRQQQTAWENRGAGRQFFADCSLAVAADASASIMHAPHRAGSTVFRGGTAQNAPAERRDTLNSSRYAEEGRGKHAR